MATVVIGVVCLCAGTYFFFLKEDCLVGLLIVASVFQAAAAVSIADRGIQPYYIIAAFIILRAIANRALGFHSNKSVAQGKWLLLFGAIAVVSAFVLPIIFRGIPVYEPKIGIDDGLFLRPPLEFGWNNIGQAGFLAVHIATVYASLGIRYSIEKTRKAYLWAFYLATFFVLLQSICQLLGVSSPDSVLHNNYAGSEGKPLGMNGTRNPGTFSEQSIAGVFFLMYCVGFLAQYFAGKKSTLRFLLALVASGLVASTGSIFSFGVSALALFWSHFPFRFPFYVNVRRVKRMLWLMLCIAVPVGVALALFPSYRGALTDLTVSKGESASFVDRLAADLFSLNLTLQTYGIGVGLGSSRASSMATTLLSNIGIPGSVVLCAFYFKLFGNLAEEFGWIRWAAYAILVNMCVGIADITLPIFWIPILLAVQVNAGAAKPEAPTLVAASRGQHNAKQP